VKDHSLEQALQSQPTSESNGNKSGAIQLLAKAQDFKNTQTLVEHQALVFDISELLLEISIVLCSVSLLAESKIYWKSSFVVSAVGSVVLLCGTLMLRFPWLLPQWLFGSG
jgi:hypothetical protein